MTLGQKKSQPKMAYATSHTNLLGLVSETNNLCTTLSNMVRRIKGPSAAIGDIQTTILNLLAILKNLDQDVRRDAPSYENVRGPLIHCSQMAGEMIEIYTAYEKGGVRNGYIATLGEIKHQGKSFGEKGQILPRLVKPLQLMYNYSNLQAQTETQATIEDIKRDMQKAERDMKAYIRSVEEQMQRRDEKTRMTTQGDIHRLRQCLDDIVSAQRHAMQHGPQLIIERNRSDEDARAIFGTDNVNPDFHMNVSENTAGARAVVGAGVHTPETLRMLLGGPMPGMQYGSMRPVHYIESPQIYAQQIIHGLPERDNVVVRGLTASPDTNIISGDVKVSPLFITQRR